MLYLLCISNLFNCGYMENAEFYKAQKMKLKQSLIWGYLGQISIVLSIIRKISEFI